MAMIKIFDATDRNFSTAGNIVIEPTKCIEYKKKSLNGWYIEVEMPIKYKEYIEKDKLCVIKTKSKLNPQAFRIEEDIKYTNRKISFTAVHVMFDADRYFLLDVRPTNLNGLNALNYINSRTDNISPFVVYSNVENLNTAYFIRKTLLEAWTVIEERWGGVFDADNWNISFMQSVGHDNGETIIYGKNMQSMEIYEDWSNVVTKLYPVGYDGIMLPEKYITSDVQYDIPYTKKIEFQTELEDDEKTEENLIRELRINANAYIEENKYPKVSYTTASNINNNMEIGDTIQVLHPLVSIQTEVMEYEYNNISDRIISMTFGNYSRDVKRKFNNIKNTIKQLNQEISKQEIAISNQTNLINSLNKSGYIYIDDNEILILDTLPKENAHNVWRWNMGGLGFSSNGYEGPFETAITIDGSINANFITTGTIAVSRIEGLANIIESVVSNVTEQNNKISTLTQTVDELSSKISDVADVTVHGESDYAVISLEDINESEPIMVKVHAVGENISYTYPSNILYPSDTTYLRNRILRFTNTNTNVSTDYELPDDLLYYNSEIYDEFYLDYESHTCEVTKRCGYNEDGTVCALAEEVVTSYTYPTIELQNGNYTIRLLGYETAYLFVRLMASNIYTTQFATKVEVNSAITQTTQDINLSVNQKLTNYSTTNEMNTAINLAKDSITSIVSQTYITKTDSANNIDTAKNAAINSANNTTDTKLQNYYTKAQTESKITQKADEITTSVSATYLTKNNASNTYLTKNNANTTYLNKQDAIDIYLSKTSASSTYLTQNNASNTYATKASLTLKVDKSSLISEINASADVIRLSSGRLIIDSGNFQLDANGNMSCSNANISGTITGSTITGSTLQINESGGTITYVGGGQMYVKGSGWKNELNLGGFSCVDGSKETSISSDRIFMTSNNYVPSGQYLPDTYMIIEPSRIELKYTNSVSGYIKISEDDSENIWITNSYIHIKDNDGNTLSIKPHNFFSSNRGYPIQVFYADETRSRGTILGRGVNNFELKNQFSSSTYLEFQDELFGTLYGISVWQSDRKYKENIEQSDANGIEMINKIPHHSFDWKVDKKYVECGYIAQDMEQVNPNFVTKIEQGNGEYNYQINEQYIIPYITKALQEQYKENQKLKKEIEEIKQYLWREGVDIDE